MTLKREDYVGLLYAEMKYVAGMEMNICSLIVDYSANGISLNEAKKRRKEVIDLKKHTKSKFGTIHFGNCGETFYFPMGDAMKYKMTPDYYDKSKYMLRDYVDEMQTVPETQSSVH